MHKSRCGNDVTRVEVPAGKRGYPFTGGCTEWRVNGLLHRDGGLPAIECVNGNQEWYECGLRHRGGDLPAVKHVDGRREWYTHGLRHRDDDLPAVLAWNGDRQWYVCGELHRGGDRPAIEAWNGDREWYVGGKRHRDGDWPAIVRPNGDRLWFTHDTLHRGGGLSAIKRANGDREWHVHGVLHREDGLPAVEDADGEQVWYVHGEYVKRRVAPTKQAARLAEERVAPLAHATITAVVATRPHDVYADAAAGWAAYTHGEWCREDEWKCVAQGGCSGEWRREDEWNCACDGCSGEWCRDDDAREFGATWDCVARIDGCSPATEAEAETGGGGGGSENGAVTDGTVKAEDGGAAADEIRVFSEMLAALASSRQTKPGSGDAGAEEVADAKPGDGTVATDMAAEGAEQP